MNRRGSRHLLTDNPTAVGAVTVLVSIVVVFMAYNANAGLPFVEAYRISASVPDASALVEGNDVRVGGVRVGVVERIQPEATDDGRFAARLDLKLDQTVNPLPADTTVVVRTRSALGLKYVELNPGSGPDELPESGSLPLSAATPHAVDLDQVLNVFDEKTRKGQQQQLAGLGGALAGRGAGLNAALGSLPSTLRLLEPVARNLSDPRTGLERFIRAAGAAASEVAPVGEQQANMIVSLAVTFEALVASEPGLAETIERSPSALRQTSESLPEISRLLRDTSVLFAELRPTAAELVTVAPELDAAFEVAEPALEVAYKLNRQLPPTASALVAFGEDNRVTSGIAGLTKATDQASPALEFIAPAQTTCNYAALLLRNLASVFSLGDGVGTRQRFIAFQPPLNANGEGSPSSAPANGPGKANHLHYNPYPNTASPGQPRECEAGNESYLTGETVIGNVPGNQGTVTEVSGGSG